jgi:release factor glutamine methyltransferase
VFGGEDGLESLRTVMQESLPRLAPGGWLIMEFGYGQDGDVSSLVTQVAGLTLVKIRNDIQDIPRTAVISRT